MLRVLLHRRWSGDKGERARKRHGFLYTCRDIGWRWRNVAGGRRPGRRSWLLGRHGCDVRYGISFNGTLASFHGLTP